MNVQEIIQQLTQGFTAFTAGNALMIVVGIVLVTLAVVKEYEPVLLLPIGFGCIIANLGMSYEHGMMKVILKTLASLSVREMKSMPSKRRRGSHLKRSGRIWRVIASDRLRMSR